MSRQIVFEETNVEEVHIIIDFVCKYQCSIVTYCMMIILGHNEAIYNV